MRIAGFFLALSALSLVHGLNLREYQAGRGSSSRQAESQDGLKSARSPDSRRHHSVTKRDARADYENDTRYRPYMKAVIDNILETASIVKFIFSKDGAPASNTTGEQRLVRVSDYEDYARQHMDPDAWMYFNLGASTLTTKADNEAAFQRYRLMPNYLMNVADFNSSLEVLGSKVSMPIGLSPAAVYNWAHPDGDREAARAAASLGAVHILSALASTTIEDVAEAIPDAVRWQQVQFTVPRNSTLDIVQRAEKAGCRAIVVTIDEPVIRISYELMRHTDGEVKLPDFVEPVNQRYPSDSMVDPRQSWADIAWLKKQTSLPIVLKGLLNPDAVPLAKQAGVSGILVSNHGGRVIDGVPATIDALPGMVKAAKAVGGGIEIYMDGGIRTGMDVFKALAMGARMVFVGRPPVWGVSHSGRQGVENILNILQTEFVNTAQLSGVPSIQDISPKRVIKR